MTVVYSARAAFDARVSYQDPVSLAQEGNLPEIPDHEFHLLTKPPHRYFEFIINDVATDYNWIASFVSENWQGMAEKEGKKPVHWYGFDIGLNRSSHGRICDDKASTSAILKKRKIAHFVHRFFSKTEIPTELSTTTASSSANEKAEEIGTKEWKRIDEYAKEHNYNIVIKPKSESGGTGVVHVTSRQQLKEALKEHFKTYSEVCLSPYEEIEYEFRIVMLNGKPKLMFKKIPPRLIGDGKSTIAELLKNFHEKGIGPEIPPLDPHSQPTLKEKFAHKMRSVRRRGRIAASKAPLPAHLNLQEIPAAGKFVNLDWKHNLCQGATSEFLDHTLDQEPSQRPIANENLASSASASSSSCESKIIDITSVMKSSCATPNQDLDELTRNLIELAKKTAEAVDFVFASVDIALLKDGSLKVVEINSGVMMENLIQEHSVDGKTLEGEGFKKARPIYEEAFCLRTGETFLNKSCEANKDVSKVSLAYAADPVVQLSQFIG